MKKLIGVLMQISRKNLSIIIGVLCSVLVVVNFVFTANVILKQASIYIISMLVCTIMVLLFLFWVWGVFNTIKKTEKINEQRANWFKFSFGIFGGFFLLTVFLGLVYFTQNGEYIPVKEIKSLLIIYSAIAALSYVYLGVYISTLLSKYRKQHNLNIGVYLLNSLLVFLFPIGIPFLRTDLK